MPFLTESGERRQRTKLVPTQAPEDLVVHTEFGVSQTPEGPRLSEGQKAILKNKKTHNLRAVLASEIGLEWRDADNQKISGSNKWAAESYILVSDAAEE